MKNWVLGIDAGGSNTRAMIALRMQMREAEGRRDETFGVGNYRQIGLKGVRSLLKEVVDGMSVQPSNTTVVAGFAGAGTPASIVVITQLLTEMGFRSEDVHVTSDAGLLLWALGGTGAVLIAGTGSICFGRADELGEEIRAGGYGFRMPSEAGGYRLGIWAIDVALKIDDGRQQQPSILFDEVRRHFGLDDLREIVPRLYPVFDEAPGDVRERIAKLAPVVLKAAAGGDQVAQKMVVDTINDLVDHLKAVIGRLGAKPKQVGLHGGLFNDPHAETLLLKPLIHYLDELGLDWTLLHMGETDPLLAAMQYAVSR